tara:strand:+ start:52 stop:300 length:249 start_codon:yes stop_codon:yes gene_type:complete
LYFLSFVCTGSNLTTPSANAYNVLSRPEPTFIPGRILMRQRSFKIFPAFTTWPPQHLTPKRFALESRPFLVLPAPFLCAIIN